MYTRLHEKLGLSDHLAVLQVLVNKIVSNLKHRSEVGEVTDARALTLTLTLTLSLTLTLTLTLRLTR